MSHKHNFRKIPVLVLTAIWALLLVATGGCTDAKDMVSPVPPPLQITTTTLPNGIVGQVYGPVFLTATDGTTPYRWSEVGSNLSTYGLRLTARGVITGTSTQVGICNFMVDVMDSSSPAESIQRALAITICGPPFAALWGGTEDDRIYGVGVDAWGNIYCAGYTQTSGTWLLDALLLKYDSSGTLQWAKTWGDDGDDLAVGIAIDSNDNIYCAGRSLPIMLLKYDTSGTLQWAKTWWIPGWNEIDGVAVDSGSNVYLGGLTKSYAGTWQTITTGNEDSLSGLEGTPSGTESSPPVWDEFWVGLETSPIGSETGAGEEDALLLKNWQ